MKNLNNKILSILSIGALSIMVTACGSNSASSKSKSVEGGKIEQISIKTDGQNIELRPTDGSNVKVKMKSDEELPVKVDGNSLAVDIGESSKFINFKTETLYVDLPSDMYKKISLETQSGNITGENLKAENLLVTSDSGNIDIDGYEGKKVTGDVVAGNVKFNSASGDFDLNNETGDITISHKGSFNSDSNLFTQSGKINLSFNGKPDNLKIEAVTESGKINTTLFPSEDITEKSGGNQLNSKLGSSGPVLSVRSSSGNIKLD
ncbi:DUF4097 family beta strand repeat-containing protein [Priestia megaterium]|uniref:DUF4097 family beta strand repeat-containing protein n=1 Tax=Priestia megaterium TaxID=1404 RepID=UPI00101D5248|nr:DUF4097 family beta strand repeat-containing protein [Priestia megaterium]